MAISEVIIKRWFARLALGVSFACMLAPSFGRKLPYILTQNSFNIRTYSLFPSLLLFFIYFTFYHKWNGAQKTGFQMAFGYTNKKAKRKVGLVILALVAMTGGFSWLAGYTMASVAYLVANKPYIQKFKVNSKKSVSNLIEIELKNLSNQETAYLRLRNGVFNEDVFKYGAKVEIEGRTSVFGTIAEKVTAETMGSD